MSNTISVGKRINQVNIAGLGVVNLEMATGKRALVFKDLSKELQTVKDDNEKSLEVMCNIIAEFSNFEKGEDVRNTLTDLEIMDLYFAIQGDIETTKRLFTLTSQSK